MTLDREGQSRMKNLSIGGQNYRLPGGLNDFQRAMYVHLIDWKWKHITRDPGHYATDDYDAILPAQFAGSYALIYPGIVAALQTHLQAFPFRIHKHFDHMASSQAANVNLFLPILLHANADAILSRLKPDFARLATNELDHGYRIEFWDEPFGNLGDKSEAAGTDSDIAIAYYNHQDELCLWLVEHKLTEKEFTECGGFKSNGRQTRHDCAKSFSEILNDKSACYYHDARKFHYWDLTDADQAFFPNHARHKHCPFRSGMNQLWRNQLLALSVEQDPRQPYKHAFFSVVKHPDNVHLDETLAAYRDLIAKNPKFSVFTSKDVLCAAGKVGDHQLNQWIDWYQGLYKV